MFDQKQRSKVEFKKLTHKIMMIKSVAFMKIVLIRDDASECS